MLQYILECIAFQLVFLIIYDLFLKRETFFQWNRLYLLATYILSMTLPWIKIEAMKTTVPKAFQAYPEFLWNINNANAIDVMAEESSFSISWEYAILFGGMILATLLLAYKLVQILSLRRKGEVHYFKDFTQIIVSNSAIAFSFFKSIFLGDKIFKQEHKSIVQHELVHIRQRHSYDLMFFELMRIVGWFNPLVYVYQNRISELHEFIADAKVSKTHKKEQYQLLLSQVFQTQNISFVNQFFKTSLIKKRIVMLQKTKSKKIWKLKYLLLVPLVFGMLAYSATEVEEENNYVGTVNLSTETITVSDIENLSLEEESIIFEALKKLSETNEEWELYVKDKSSTMKFIPSDNGSYLSGPNGEKIYAKLAIDSKLSKSETDLFKAFLVDKKSQIQSANSVDRYNQLVEERRRLLKSSNEKNPIIVDLDQQLMALRKAMKESKVSQASLKTETVPFATVEKAPVFPGCENEGDRKECFKAKVLKHISKNFRYPKEAHDQGIQGRVSAIFMITDGGAITNIKTRGPAKVLEDEVERILNRLPDMVPGEHEGKKVNVMFSVPVTFKLDSDEVVSKAQVSTFETDGKVPFATVDEVPVFPGCENADNKRKCFNKAMQKHISKNFNYPQEAQDKGVQGRVSTMFTISENGSIQNVRMRGPDQLLEKEAARIIARLPKMIPGKHKGKAVGVPYSIPITFKLQGNNSEKEVSPLGLSFNTDPIYYIDGEESSKEQLNLILPDDIESVFVLKGEAAVAKYGNKAANGVVEVITKKDRNKPVNFKLSEIAGKTPLLIINGEESELSVAQIDPDEVVTMQVLKGAAAEEKYGEKGKNGVVEITLKKQD